MTKDTHIGRRTVLRALGGAATVGAASSTAAAQEGGTETTETTTEEPGEEIVAQLGEVVTLRSWEYEDGAFSLTLTAEYPSAIKITDTGAVMEAITSGSGSATVEIPSRGFDIDDRTTITFEAVEFDGAAALTVASTRGTVLIRTDSVSAGRPAVKYSTAGALTAGAALGTGYYSYRRSKEKLEESDEPEIDRIG